MAKFVVNAAMKGPLLKVLDGKSFDGVANIKYVSSKGMNHEFECDSDLPQEKLAAYIKGQVKKDPVGATLYFKVS